MSPLRPIRLQTSAIQFKQGSALIKHTKLVYGAF
jgi:hypothetical protein